MTIISFLLVLYVVYVWIRKRSFDKSMTDIIALDIILHICVSIGYFLRIGYDLDFCYFTDILILFYGILKLLSGKKISGKLFLNYFFFIGCMLISLWGLEVFPYKELMVTNGASWDLYIRGNDHLRLAGFTMENLVMFIKSFTIVTCVLFLRTFISMEMWDEIFDKIYIWIKIILSIGIFEAMTRYVFKSAIFNLMTMWLFGLTSSTYDISIARGNGYMLQGLTREGSTYTYSLAILCIFLYIRSYGDKKARYWLSVALGLMALSMAVTAIYCFVFLLAMRAIFDLYMHLSKYRFFLKHLAPICIIVIFISLVMDKRSEDPGYILWRITDAYKTLKMVFDGSWRSFTGWYGSNQLRLISAWETLKLTIQRPLFGFGVGTTTSHSSLATLLAEVGYIGGFCWYRFYFCDKENWVDKKGKKFMAGMFLCYLGMNLLSGLERLIISIGNLFIFMMILKVIERRKKHEDNIDHSCI